MNSNDGSKSNFSEYEGDGGAAELSKEDCRVFDTSLVEEVDCFRFRTVFLLIGYLQVLELDLHLSQPFGSPLHRSCVNP